MSRFFLEISYNGTAYHGWQVQPNAHTVQAELTEKLSVLLKHEINLVGSGRTDTGVHCRQQFAHFDTNRELDDLPGFTHKLNAFLPEDIFIARIRPVTPDAHARFSALSRTYEYWLSIRKNPLLPKLAYCFSKEVDVDKMNYAAALLLSYEDFKAFSKVHADVKHHRCDVMYARWKPKGEVWVFTIRANRFLRGMVRLITGSLLEVGTGRLGIEDFEERIKQKTRGNERFSVPAHGLYLTQVTYPKDIFMD